MSRFSTLLFAVVFCLFASLPTLTSCGDNTDEPNPVVPEAKEGTYKIVVSMVGDVQEYSPVISVLGLHNASACTPEVGAIADSVYNAAPDKRTKGYSTYHISLPYAKYPSIFRSPISLVTIPQAHGLSVTVASVGAFNGSFAARVAFNFKGYFNNTLVKDTLIKQGPHDPMIEYHVGNMSSDINKAYQNAQK